MQPFASNDLVTSALSFAVQRLKHCPLGKTSGTLVCCTIDNADVTKSLPANGCIHACMDKPFVD